MYRKLFLYGIIIFFEGTNTGIYIGKYYESITG